MAQERCIRRCAQGGRLWTIGEVRQAALDDRGNPTASINFRLVEGDERVDPHRVYDSPEAQRQREESGQRDRTAAIQRAAYALDPEDDALWTQGGEPAVQAVFSKVGFEVNRASIRAAIHDYDREQAKTGLKR